MQGLREQTPEPVRVSSGAGQPGRLVLWTQEVILHSQAKAT